jgi:hypothetical protein
MGRRPLADYNLESRRMRVCLPLSSWSGLKALSEELHLPLDSLIVKALEDLADGHLALLSGRLHEHLIAARLVAQAKSARVVPL